MKLTKSELEAMKKKAMDEVDRAKIVTERNTGVVSMCEWILSHYELDEVQSPENDSKE